MQTLHQLRSNISGGPSGILCPLGIVAGIDGNSTKTWSSVTATEDDFVFCHMDLQGSNILVDPLTLKVIAIIDWEFAGFYPESHDIAFYEKTTPSGQQVWETPDVVAKMKEFWSSCEQNT